MQSKIWRFVSLLTVLALIFGLLLVSSPSSAAPATVQPDQPKPGLRVIKPVFMGESQPLRELVPLKREPGKPEQLRSLRDQLVIPKTRVESAGQVDRSIVQDRPGAPNMPSPVANFEGVGNVDFVLPPDTQGDIGYDPIADKKYYVQWVNLSFQIWDVTNPLAPVSLYGPAAGNTLWTGSGTICASNNDGDPITLFDHLANRWIMSQFALGFPNNFHQCIAVSATADPTGAWYLYDYQTSTTMMNDYPKFGVWPDGYYMTVNQFDGGNFDWGGAGVAVFERQAMLSGLVARMIYIDIGATNLDYGGMLPSDLDGPPPTMGTPNYFMEWDDSAWLGDPYDTLRIWEFKTDWSNPANTTFGLNASFDPNYTISTTDVDPDLCGYNRSCIPQPGTAQGLDAISDRLMYRLQYRNFGSYQTLISNRTVDANGADHAGVYWFELRKSGSNWGLFQEGVYAPDADHRWMASLAMDDSGGIALGYSVSSGSTYPSIRYTGRLAGDPAGTMPQGEAQLIAGSGSQTHSAARWGDYSMMGLDPEDGCTFWYTQEYIQTTGSANWQTRIGSFKFPSCTSLPTGTLQGTVTDGANPVVGATVTATGGAMTITDALGHYTLVLQAGNYDVTAAKFGYTSSTVNNVAILDSQTTTQDFTLSLAPLYTVSGVVKDATTGWQLYAKLGILGYPYSPIFTDPATGEYSVKLPAGSYSFNVEAMSGGYDTASALITVSADQTQDFDLAVDPDLCTAPGYLPGGFFEGFETWPLTGWSIVDNTGGGGLVWDSNLNYGVGNYTGGSGLSAVVDSNEFGFTPYDTALVSPVLNSASLSSLILKYKANFQSYSGLEALDLDITDDGGSTWTNLSHWTTDHGALYGLPGEEVSIDLSPYMSLPATFQLRWRYYTSDTSPWDWYAQVDEVSIGHSCGPIASGGLIVGGVYDDNTGDPVLNPSVSDAVPNQALLVDTAQDPAQPNPLYIIGEPAGTVALTAQAPYYQSETLTPVVTAGQTTRQDFHLEAGQLSADPSALSFTVTIPDPTDTKPLTLTNSGGITAGLQVFPINGEYLYLAPTGPFAKHTRHIGPKDLNNRDAKKLRLDPTPRNVSPLSAGALLDSWGTGLGGSWGIGYDHDQTDLWVGSIGLGGGDDLDHGFLPDGTSTGDTMDTTPWMAVFAADMTYNPFTRTIWQVNVGGDNCVYEMDPASLAATGRKICPPFGTSERGLAYDPLTDTYFAGSWNDGIVNHFAPDGTLLDSAAVNLSISGLAFNPSTRHLFVMTNHPWDWGLLDVYVLDVEDSYAIIGGFNLRDGSSNAFAEYAQAGLEIDCNGRLFAVDQSLNKVYVADSGETGVCNWRADWLSVAPETGTVPSLDDLLLNVSVDALGMPLGIYKAHLRVVNDTPYGDLIVPVTLNVVGSTTFIYMPVVGR